MRAHFAAIIVMAWPSSVPLPDRDPPQAPVSATQAAAQTRPAVESRDLRAGDDENKRYFLIGSADLNKPKDGGFRLLLVLPGGDGSAAFQPFVQRIYENALPANYLIAQLVAPRWSDEQANQLVWPTKLSPWEGMKFSTEEFISSVIDDVKKRCTIDDKHIFTLSWSSSGPAAYAASLDEKTQITGSLVAMSVFKPDQLPDLKRAKDKLYYILHSPQDMIPIRFAEAARDQLAAAGAKTKLQTYEGGHGWHGDVYGNIRAGVEWLEGQQAS